MTAAPASHSHEWIESFKGIIMAFLMALVFRAFVIEGFEIPTGSMAPTLRGMHTQWRSPHSGNDWAVGPFFYGPGRIPLHPQQSGVRAMTGEGQIIERTPTMTLRDPETLIPVSSNSKPTRGGDRVFILKYIWPFYTPDRYDVAVFKNPRDPTQNYIKRLTGLGPEEIAIIDGDIFSRPLVPGEALPPAAMNTWALDGWSVRRKPDDAQRATWQPVFDSSFTPINAVRDGRALFRNPWIAAGANPGSWKFGPGGDCALEGDSGGLSWDMAARPVLDFYSYNEGTSSVNGVFPVSDLRLRCGVRPSGAGLSWTGTIKARGHEFQAVVSENSATLRMRPVGGEWGEPRGGEFSPALAPGRVTNIEFWHADQTLSLYIEGTLIARLEYPWTPAERIQNSLGASLEAIFAQPGHPLADPKLYSRPEVSMSITGGPCTLLRVGLDRDIHYQSTMYPPLNDPVPGMPSTTHSRVGRPAAATHPRTPHYLQEGEFFFCGDNSPQSLDMRLFDAPNPWVARVDPNTGVVGRDMLIGRAFVVYWPGINWKWNRLPVFDTGRIRQVR